MFHILLMKKFWFSQETYLIWSWTKSSEKSLKGSVDDDDNDNDEKENDDTSNKCGEDVNSIDSFDSSEGL